jgi:hypothetical protein
LPSGSAQFRVTDPKAPRRELDPWTRAMAHRVMRDAQSGTPRRTGTLARGWRVVKVGNAVYRVANDVPYARFVEYGTRHMAPAAMLGRAVARNRL